MRGQFSATQAAILATAAVTLARLALLPFYQTALGPDEAQYWFWGQDLDWGYYSKPPVIAWIIALPTAVLGDHAWSVRLLSPFLIGAAGLFLFGAARRLFGEREALWSLALWHLMPAVMLGATLVTTDVPLLACWSAAVYALVRLTEGQRRLAWGAALGTALGLGMLSKYAMIYFVIGLGLAALFAPRVRAVGIKPYLAALAVASLIFSPNVLWNLANGLQTVGHTADNADWRGGLQWDELSQFLGDQFGVFGLLTFLALAIGLLAIPRRWRGAAEGERMLVAFVLPPLVAICLQALLSRAHANWAMAAYPAATLLLPVWLAAGWRRWVLTVSAGLHAAVGVVFTAALLNFAVADALGLSNAVKRLRGWPETTAQVVAAFEAGGYDTLLLDDRELAAHLVWETRDLAIPIEVLDPDGRRDNTYEYAMPYTPEPGERLLLVTQADVTGPGYEVFGTVVPVGEVFVDLKAKRRGRRERTVDLWAVEQ